MLEELLLKVRFQIKDDVAHEEQHKAIERVLVKLVKKQQEEELQQNSKELTWEAIWKQTWQRTKAVYVETYIADCVVWPPLQLINFSFVPLKYQVLYVNVANLFWNTFLSFMANKPSH